MSGSIAAAKKGMMDFGRAERPQRVLMVSGDFVLTGGMDRANYALADYLARNDVQVELVAHRVADELATLPNVTLHRVPKPAGSYFLGSHFLAREGQKRAGEVLRRGGQVVVNGGNCLIQGVNWVHYVHAAYVPQNNSVSRRLKQLVERPGQLRAERRGLAMAKLVIANSEATRRFLIDQFGLSADKVKTIHYGIDEQRFRPSAPAERQELRKRFGWDASPRVLFIGALGDRRKGFDTVARAWKRLQRDGKWDARLVVIGSGAERARWQRELSAIDSDHAVEFLGFREDVCDLLRGGDCLVAPTRYEAYGLGVKEAICCGLPAFVSRSAGVAEHFAAAEMSRLILDDPDDDAALAAKLRAWQVNRAAYQESVAALGQTLRSRSWDTMAEQITAAISEKRETRD